MSTMNNKMGNAFDLSLPSLQGTFANYNNVTPVNPIEPVYPGYSASSPVTQYTDPHGETWLSLGNNKVRRMSDGAIMNYDSSFHRPMANYQDNPFMPAGDLNFTPSNQFFFTDSQLPQAQAPMTAQDAQALLFNSQLLPFLRKNGTKLVPAK